MKLVLRGKRTPTGPLERMVLHHSYSLEELQQQLDRAIETNSTLMVLTADEGKVRLSPAQYLSLSLTRET